MLPMSRLGIQISTFLLASALVGCGGGGAAKTTGATASPSGTSTGSGTGALPAQGAGSAAQWQTALAAIGPAYSPATPTFDAASFVRWNTFLTRGWFGLRPVLDPLLVQNVTQALRGFTSGIAVVQGIRSVTVDTAAAPQFGPAGTATRLDFQLPGAAGAWSIEATLGVSVQFSTTVVGVPINVMLPGDLTLRVADVRLGAPIDFDVSDPRRPRAVAIGTPTVNFRIDLSSSSTLIQQAAAPLAQLLAPVVRAGLLAACMIAPSQAASTLASLDVAPWGRGGPAGSIGALAVAAPVDLRASAEAVSDEIQRVHMPFGTVLGVVFDQPGYGHGAVTGYQDYGDSAIWTGSYLAGEAMRWELTQDPRALAGATRALDGLWADLDLADQNGGLLARAIVPLSSPFVKDLQSNGDYYEGVHKGVAIGGIGSISRDQYLGTLMGLTQTMLRVPSLKADAARLVARMVRYIDSKNWVVGEHNSGIPTAEMPQTPDLIWAFMASANIADRATFGPMHDANVDLPRNEWLSAWTSSRVEWGSYYKFNLAHEVLMTELACDSDPSIYREHLKSIEITRDVIGHHQNAWFDTVYAIAVPTAAQGLSAQIETELQRWCLRPRRDFGVNNSADPSVQRAPNPNKEVGAPPEVATMPLPIEKRTSGDFLWQTGPFDLDGGGNPLLQQPGMDLTLPYWAARSFGIVR